MLLGVAPVSASANDVIEWLLVTLGLVLVFVVLAGVVIRFARGRRRQQLEMISAAIVLWAILAAASMSYFFMRKMDWNAEVQQRMYSGYYDPSDTADRPTVPIAFWSGLGVCYAVMLAWAASGPASVEGVERQA